MKSLSEIETTSKRASRAAGFSWGIAEEVGKCVRLLLCTKRPDNLLTQGLPLKSQREQGASTL